MVVLHLKKKKLQCESSRCQLSVRVNNLLCVIYFGQFEDDHNLSLAHVFVNTANMHNVPKGWLIIFTKVNCIGDIIKFLHNVDQTSASK